MTTMPKASGLLGTRRSTGAASAFSEGGGQAMANSAQALFAATAECQRETMSFVAMRLEKDGVAARDIMACKNPADVASMQARWMEETLRDYSAHMSRLVAICTSSVNGAGGFQG